MTISRSGSVPRPPTGSQGAYPLVHRRTPVVGWTLGAGGAWSACVISKVPLQNKRLLIFSVSEVKLFQET